MQQRKESGIREQRQLANGQSTMEDSSANDDEDADDYDNDAAPTADDNDDDDDDVQMDFPMVAEYQFYQRFEPYVSSGRSTAKCVFITYFALEDYI